MSQTPRVFRRKVLSERTASRITGLRDDAALLDAGDIHTLGKGLVALRGNVLRLFRFFEQTFLGLARRFGADERHYPVLLPLEILEEVGYLGHFPQHVTFCSHFPEDVPLLEAVARAAAADHGRLAGALRQQLAPATHALKPAVCLPCYGQHRDAVVPEGEVVRVTMQNHVFRNESAGYDALARLWDFQVRDIVFMGSQRAVHALRQEVMDACMELCAELDLSATLELANDPFFLDQNAHKVMYQRLGEVKYELLLPIPHRNLQVAVSSFNLHRDFYASVYNIRQSTGELAETACMGFGLERWVYGFLSQKGMEPDGWPAQVAAWVAEQAVRT
jgi:seryl-tRNA synthetase